MRISLLLVGTLLLTACSVLGRGRSQPNDITLCVVNSAVMGTLRVWADGRGRTHNVPSGQEECRTVGSGSSEVRVYAETIGGGAQGPATGSAVVPGRPGECWLWDFRGFADDGNLVPCDFSRRSRS